MKRAVRLWGALSRGALLAAVLCCASAAAPAGDWSAEARPALEAYARGDVAKARQECAAILDGASAGPLRRDAAAIQSLILLTSEGRSEARDGRARLGELAAEDATLADRPECALALGIGALTLQESPAALDHLDRAAAGFRRAGDSARELAALTALAEAWSAHNEWPNTPAGLGVATPDGPEAARQLRRRQIERLRQRVDELPQHETAAQSIALTLADLLLRSDDTSAEGAAIFAELAAATPVTPAAARAALRLAELRSDSGDAAAALELLERVAKLGPAPLAGEAARKLAEARAARIEILTPTEIAADAAAPLHLRVRNLASVEVEVRAVDVEAWLVSPRRGDESALPDSGAVAFTARLETGAALPSAWDSVASGAGASLRLAAGGYVLIAAARAADGRELRVQRLLIATGIRGVCAIGRERAVAWVAARPDAVAGAPLGATGGADAPPSVKFWMQRSFAPQRHELAGGVASFRLPAEASVMREKGWYCLFRAGDHLALCRGEHDRAAVGLRERAALLVGPNTVSVGETIYVAGWLTGGAANAAGEAELELVDALDRVAARAKCAISTSGMFSAEFRATPEMADRHLSVVVRRGGRVAESLLAGRSTYVRPLDAPRTTVDLRIPRRLMGDAPLLSGAVSAAYPWGSPMAGAAVTMTLRGARLPTTASESVLVSAPATWKAQLDSDGRMTFTQPVGGLQLPDGPLALGVWAEVRAADERAAVATEYALAAPAPAWAWITTDPLNPRAGSPVRFDFGWFDPTGAPLSGEARADIVTAAGSGASLPLTLGDWGLRSGAWRPPGEGAYSVEVSAPRAAGGPVAASQPIDVAPPTSLDTAARASTLLSDARQVGAAGDRVSVRLAGAADAPLLLLAEQGDPVALGVVAAAARAGEVEVSARLNSGAASLAAVGWVGDRAQVMTDSPIDRADADLQLELSPASDEPRAGESFRVRVALCHRDGSPATDKSADVLLRLADAQDGRAVRWVPGAPREIADYDTFGFQLAESGAPPGASDARARPLRRGDVVCAEDAAVLLSGATAWCGTAALRDGVAHIDVPLPADAGWARLGAVAVTADGRVARKSLLLRVGGAVGVRLDAPTRLAIGDRSVVAVRLDARGEAESKAEIRWKLGDGLRLERQRRVSRGSSVEIPRAEVTPVDVPGNAPVWIVATVEAVRAGDATVRADVSSDGRTTSRERVVRVEADTPPPAGDVLPVRRWVYRYTTGGIDGPADAPAGAWIPLNAGDTLRPGQRVIVREQIQISGGLRDVNWAQALPATCYPLDVDPPDVKAIGRRLPESLDEISYRADSVPAGEVRHEYALAVVRPGACRIPAPRISAAGRPLAVAVAPAELTIVVSDEP